MRRPRPNPLPVALLALALLTPGCAGEDTAASAESASLDFRLPSLDGREVGPGDYPGKAMLVEFWATWCTPCRAQAKILEDLYAEVDRERAEFVAISVGEPEPTVRAFVEKNPFPYPVLLDSADTLSARLMIYALPTVMILDPAGRIVYFEQGVSPPSALRAALGEATASAAM